MYYLWRLLNGCSKAQNVLSLVLICHICKPSFDYGYRYGMRGRELVQNVGKTMVQGGGTFGTFMAIGTGIRC